jgi:hypothetical protein
LSTVNQGARRARHAQYESTILERDRGQTLNLCVY